jgi:carbon-monoxide dehydrogenase medium subunit
MREFDYHEPATIDEAIVLLGRHPDSALLAGGTDLLVQLKEHLRQPAHVINLKKISGLDGLSFDEVQGLRIGALATARELETSAIVARHYAGLGQALTHFASIQVRNRATVAGNVCRASPSADALPPLIADSAVLHLRGPRGQRIVAAEDFCTGPGRTVLAPGEVLVQIVVPPPAPHTGKAYLKLGRRVEMELATVGVAVTLTRAGDTCTAVRIALAAVAPTPLRAREAEDLLAGCTLDAECLAAAARAAADAARPIADVRGSADYRRRMVAVLTRRALEQAWEQAS